MRSCRTRSVLINAKKLAPAKWWGNYGGHLPLLSRVATTVLAQVIKLCLPSFYLFFYLSLNFGLSAHDLTSHVCVPHAQVVCASAAERNWSIYGQIKTLKRSRMGHDVGDKLVYCHEALALRTKMAKGGYSQAVVPWDEDSDSDSDNSEDEDYSALTV
mmetsp:Transcript_6187/g.16106  ORF Transcript_6187/g.16106 Transcript_6187/m.16106 type:complete len:158 (+) Transcript_6187:1773-2246(+)